MHVRAELDERIGQVRAHEPVGARDEHGAAPVDVAEVALERVEVGRGPDRVAHAAATRVSGSVESEPCKRSSPHCRRSNRLAGLARRLGLGPIVDRVAPIASRPFEHFVLDVDGVQLGGTNLAQLHYVRELRELGRERTFVRLLAEAIPSGGVDRRRWSPPRLRHGPRGAGGRAGRSGVRVRAERRRAECSAREPRSRTASASGSRSSPRRSATRRARARSSSGATRAASTSRPATPIRSRSTSSAPTS